MKSEEDEAFDELARKQGSWGGGFKAKQAMAADKQHWNEDEWRRNNWRCGHGWLRGEQCESCNAPQPPSEWAGIKAILDEYGLQAIDFVADFKAALAQPAQEPVAWMNPYGGVLLRLFTGLEKNSYTIPLYTTPPQRTWVGLTAEDFSAIKFPTEMRFPAEFRAGARWADVKLKEKNNA